MDDAKESPLDMLGPAGTRRPLASFIRGAPLVPAPEPTSRLVAEWAAGLAPADRHRLEQLFTAHGLLRKLIEAVAGNSPFLWDLMKADPARLVEVLEADPDQHLAARLAVTAREVAATVDVQVAMRLLRQMKAEVCLLIALADIGGVWSTMQITRALTEVADCALSASVRFLLSQGVRQGKLAPSVAESSDGSGYIVLAMGKMGAFELNYSSDIDLIILFDPA